MIIDFNKTNGGGVTPEQVEQEIQSALTPYWESGETKDYVDEAVSGIDLSNYYTSGETDAAIAEAVSGLATEQYVQDALSGVDLTNYWTSAQTEDAISAATSGKADAANTAAHSNGFTFPKWNTQGIITGKTGDFYLKKITLNGNGNSWLSYSNYITQPDFYAPTTSGNAGEVLVSLGNGSAPVWSALTFITSADVESQILDKNYITSAQAETQILEKEYITAEDIEPDVIYEAEGSDPGFYAVNSSALTSWQIENLDLSPYKFVRFYIKAADIAFNSSNNYTAPMYVDVNLDEKSLGSQYRAYVGVTSNICAGNRNRSYHTIAAVDITKSKVALLFQVSLWDISTSSAAGDGRYCYKIEGYRYNVCGAGEQGGGSGQTYTAGPNIDISPAGVISVSGLSTINGSAITNGGNLVIEGGGGDISEYWNSAETKTYVDSAITQVQDQIDTMDEVVSDALNVLNAQLITKVSSAYITNIWKGTQAQYDAITTKDPNTFYIITGTNN